jgi:tetratricopeptide (TPR) repeat protein
VRPRCWMKLMSAALAAVLSAAAPAQRAEPPEKLTRYQEATKLLAEARSLAKARDWKASGELFDQFIRVHGTYQDIPDVMIEASGVFGAAGDKEKQLRTLNGVKVSSPLAEFAAEARCRLAMIAYDDAVAAKDETQIEKAVQELAAYIDTFPLSYGFDHAVELVRDYYISRKKWDELEKLIENLLSVYEPATQLTVLKETILPRLPMPEKLDMAVKLVDRFVKEVKGTYEEALLLQAKMVLCDRAKQPEESLKLAREIRERWPDTPADEAASVHASDMLVALGRLEEATEADLKLIDRFSFRADTEKRVADVFARLMSLGKLDDAAKLLAAQDEADPKPADMAGRYQRYVSLAVARKDADALAKLAAELLAPSQGPQRWKTMLDGIVTNLVTLGKPAEAVQLLDRIVAAPLDPEDRADFLYRKYDLLSRDKDKTAAYAVAREFCRRFPDSARAVPLAAVLAAAPGPASQPAIDTAPAAEAKKDRDEIQRLIESDPVEAIRLTDKFAAAHATSLMVSDARMTCINALRKAGRPREAVEQCYKFVADHPLHQRTPQVFAMIAQLERDEYNYEQAAATG